VKKIILLAHKSSNILADELKNGERRRAQTVGFQLEKLNWHLVELELLFRNWPLTKREEQLRIYNLKAIRKKIMRVKMNFVFFWLDEIETYADILSKNLSPEEYIDLSVARYNLPYQFGLLLSFDPLVDLHKLQAAMK
jgi:hypothetical protein